MTEQTKRPGLTRERILVGAIALADEIGIEALTIRRLAKALAVKPMAIYHHIASKDEIIDGMVDIVFSEIDLPPTDGEWTAAIRIRCMSLRSVLAHHPWAPPLMESREVPAPATLRHHDAVLGCFLRGGLSYELTAHAYAVLDSYLYGFALQDAYLPGDGGQDIADLAEDMIETTMADYPSLAAFTTQHVIKPGYAFGNSFEFGLDLILDGISRAATLSD
jgi:AcrR family transcriptional regulator